MKDLEETLGDTPATRRARRAPLYSRILGYVVSICCFQLLLPAEMRIWNSGPQALGLLWNYSQSFDAPTPDGEIDWKPCTERLGFECGHLEVPLDYHNESLGVVRLATARYLATSKTRRLGSIFVNPGGKVIVA